MAYVLIVDVKRMMANQSGIHAVILRLFVRHAKTSRVMSLVKELKP